MIQVCCECGKYLGGSGDSGEHGEGLSHGLCSKCAEVWLEEAAKHVEEQARLRGAGGRDQGA